jgi:hypothetical protein
MASAYRVRRAADWRQNSWRVVIRLRGEARNFTKIARPVLALPKYYALDLFISVFDHAQGAEVTASLPSARSIAQS